MEDLLIFGLQAEAFNASDVLNLFYGSMGYDYDDVWKWNCNLYRGGRRDHGFYLIPLEKRFGIIEQAMSTSTYTKDLFISGFRERMKCLLLGLLDDEKNKSNQRRCNCAVKTEFKRMLVTEVFLWWYSFVAKDKEEQELLRKCWVKFLGCEKPASTKRTLALIEEKTLELEKEVKELTTSIRREHILYRKQMKEWDALKNQHYTQSEMNYLLAQIDAKYEKLLAPLKNSYEERENRYTSLAFLNGYRDYILLSKDGIKKR